MGWCPVGCYIRTFASRSTAQNGWPVDVSHHAFGPVLDGDHFNPNDWREKWSQRAFFANVANPRRTLVCGSADSSQFDFDCAPMFEELCLAHLRTEQIL